MADKIPDSVQLLLKDFLVEVNQTLPGLLNGFYLYGSIAMGNFQSGKSDVDFVALLNHPCAEDEIRQLASIHKLITHQYPQYPMDGSYLQKGDIGKLSDEIPSHPYFDGELLLIGHYEINLITWWILKNHGVTLHGEDIRLLSFNVDWNTLRDSMHNNLNTYWHKWAYNHEYFQYLLDDESIEWALLGILRLYYSFKENSITSKTNAGEYALLQLPSKWHPLINHAVALRNGEHTAYHNHLQRQHEARKFLRYIIDECNKILG